MAPTKPRPFSTKKGTLKTWKDFALSLTQYLEGLKGVSKYNTTKSRRALLLSLLDQKGIELYLTFNGNQETCALDKVMSHFQQHFDENHNELDQRQQFYELRQSDGQSFDQFLAEVNERAAACGFSERSDIEMMVRDKIIFGIRDEDLKRNLIQQKNITLQDTIMRCKPPL